MFRAYAQILGLRQAAVVWRSSFHRSVATTCCNSADTLAGALTPKAAIWNVMQITKIHFVTSAALVVANPEASIVVFLDRPARLRCSMLMGSILTLARFPIRAGLEAN